MHEELQSEIGIHKLAFGAPWIATGAIVFCGRAQRKELIDDLDVLKGKPKEKYVKVLREAVTTPTKIDNVCRAAEPYCPIAPP